MAHRALAAPFLLAPLGALLLAQGCTQDFSTFDPTGGGGSGAATSSSSTQSTSSTTTSSSSTTTNVGPGGGEGGSTTGGGEGGAGGQGGQGGTGGGCTDPVDCDDENPCTTDGCVDGACTNEAVPDGPLVDDPEDCRTIACVGGVVSDTPNDAEDPGDVNPPCQTTICQGGAVTQVFAPDGTVCGPAPQECDGAGLCIGCDPDPPDNECGADTLCAQPSCVDPGVCDPGFLPANTPLADPTDGDCQRQACTGDSAAPVSVADDTDEPADLPCANRGCNAGAPTSVTLADGTACNGGGGFCDGAGPNAANCRDCRDTVAGAGVDPGCGAGTPICDEAANAGEGQCRECQDTAAGSGTDLGCDAAQVCDPAGVGNCVDCYTDGGGVAVNCAVDEVCQPTGAGVCRTCYDLGDGVPDAGCAAPTPACQVASDTCVGCQVAADCSGSPNGPRCNRTGNTECGCQNDPDCSGNNQGDDCIGGVCGCDNVNDCPGANPISCTGGVCVY